MTLHWPWDGARNTFPWGMISFALVASVSYVIATSLSLSPSASANNMKRETGKVMPHHMVNI